jgi:hypothetical protein
MTVEQAIQQGPAAWLDAGMSEGVARQLFDETTAIKAKRRAEARQNATRQGPRNTRASPAAIRR